jgi:hypothetical protein
MILHNSAQETNIFFNRISFSISLTQSGVQQEEDCLYQQIGLKFEEETSKMLHLEHGFLWC